LTIGTRRSKRRLWIQTARLIASGPTASNNTTARKTNSANAPAMKQTQEWSNNWRIGLRMVTLYKEGTTSKTTKPWIPNVTQYQTAFTSIMSLSLTYPNRSTRGRRVFLRRGGTGPPASTMLWNTKERTDQNPSIELSRCSRIIKTIWEDWAKEIMMTCRLTLNKSTADYHPRSCKKTAQSKYSNPWGPDREARAAELAPSKATRGWWWERRPKETSSHSTHSPTTGREALLSWFLKLRRCRRGVRWWTSSIDKAWWKWRQRTPQAKRN